MCFKAYCQTQVFSLFLSIQKGSERMTTFFRLELVQGLFMSLAFYIERPFSLFSSFPAASSSKNVIGIEKKIVQTRFLLFLIRFRVRSIGGQQFFFRFLNRNDLRRSGLFFDGN